MDGCYIFREELAISHPLHGHALWEPDPGGLYDTVAVGDVGFIREGCFYTLFNALRPPSHPDPDGPEYPPRLRPKKSPHLRRGRDNQRMFCSKDVTEVSGDTSPFTLGPDDEAPVRFSCFARQGALLYLPFLSEREDTVARGDFGKWMLQNIDACFKAAENLGCGVNRMEDIILVTGLHRARSWVNVAFSENRVGAQVSFGVREFGNSGVYFDEKSVSGRGLKLGPSGANLPENQTIFVRGFRVIRTLNIWPRLRAA